MALIVADRVKETSTTTGTGAMTLAGAATGFRSFASVCSNNDTCYYAIQAVNGAGNPTGAWEVGLGTYFSGTLQRTTVAASSNSNSLVDFSTGTKQVFIDATAAYLATLGGSVAIPDGEIPFGTGAGLTSVSTFKFVDGYITLRETSLDNGTRFEIQGTPTGDPLNKARLALYTDATPYSAIQCSVPNPASTNQEEGLLIEAQLDGSQTIVSITAFSGAVLQLAGIDETGSGVATFTATNAPGTVSPQKWLKVRIGLTDGWIPWFSA